MFQTPEHIFDALVGFAEAFEKMMKMKKQSMSEKIQSSKNNKKLTRLNDLLHELDSLVCKLQQKGFSCCNRRHQEACYGLSLKQLKIDICDCSTIARFKTFLESNLCLDSSDKNETAWARLMALIWVLH